MLKWHCGRQSPEKRDKLELTTKAIEEKAGPKPSGFRWQDAAELVIGSCILAFPIALTEEAWKLSEKLSLFRIVMIALSSLLFLAWFGYYLFYRADLKGRFMEFTVRVLAAYLVTLVVCGIILGLINELAFWKQPVIALKRMILVAFPASFSATVVDSLRK